MGDNTKVEALEKELGELNKVLDEAKLKLVQAMQMDKAFIEVNERAKKLEANAEGLKAKVSEAKENGVVEFKESNVYKSDLTKIATLFLTKERIKMKRLL